MVRAVAAQYIDILDRYEQLVAAGIGQRHAIMRALADVDLRQAFIAANAMVGMDDEIANRQRLDFRKECVRALALLAAAHKPVAQQILLGDDGHVGRGKTGIEGQDGQRRGAVRCGTQCLLPAFRRLGLFQPMVAHQAAHPLPRAARIAGDDDALAVLAQAVDMLDRRLIDIGALCALGRKVACAGHAEIEHMVALWLGEPADLMDRLISLRVGPLIRCQIKRICGQWPVASGLAGLRAFPVLLIIGNRFETRFGSGRHTGIGQDQILWLQMLEQRHQPLFEHGQPMIHAGQPPPLADGLIQRITRCGRPEALPIAAAETLDRRFIQQSFGSGQQIEMIDPPDRALIRRIELANGLDLVTKEIEAQGQFAARRKEVHDGAAHGIFPGVGHGLVALIAIGGEQDGQLLPRDDRARLQARTQFAQAERAERTLRHRIGGCHQKLRRGGLGLQGGQCRHTARRDGQGRRRPVIRQAIPGRELQHFQLGHEILRGLGHCAHFRIIGRNIDCAAGGRARQIGQQPRQKAGGNGAEGKRPVGLNYSGQVRHRDLVKLRSPPHMPISDLSRSAEVRKFPGPAQFWSVQCAEGALNAESR